MICTFLLVSLAALLAATSPSQLSCPEGDCDTGAEHLNHVVEDSKVTQGPDYPKLKGTPEKEALGIEKSVSRGKTVVLGNVSGDDHSSRIAIRPSTPLNRVDVQTSSKTSLKYFDFISVKFVRPPINSSRWQTYMYGDINDLFDKHHSLNLSGLGTTGDELKARLSQLNDTVTPLITSLFLETNNIQFLRVITFPIWMEYHLLELRLDVNPLLSLSPATSFEISRLRKLKTLGLSQTSLLSVESLDLPNLAVLDLSKNKLTYIPPSLSSLRNLRELYLADNQIVYLMSGAPLSDLKNLQILSLTNNSITRIWDKSLYHVDKLYLENNCLESLSDVKDTSARAVYLDGNPWQCSCPLLEAIHSNFPQIIVDNFELKCTLEGQQVLASTLKDKDVQLDCPKWWQKLGIKVKNYFIPHPPWETVFIGLGWLTVMVTIIFAVRSGQLSRNGQVTHNSPYNVLDDKNVI